jgi:hypothetical protein
VVLRRRAEALVVPPMALLWRRLTMIPAPDMTSDLTLPPGDCPQVR